MSKNEKEELPVIVNVMDQWVGHRDITFGYCVCGREVQSNPNGHTDYVCPLCSMKLVWRV